MAYERWIFVFGSNLMGRHGRGSARRAVLFHGAEYGVGAGLTGEAYAIPTKDRRMHTLPLEAIGEHVTTFLEFARRHPTWEFMVVAIGCGLAGYRPDQIAPMFKGHPGNVILVPTLRNALPGDQ